MLAGYSVIANDSVQTLGTWIASNREKFKWTTLWAAAAGVLALTLTYGWYFEDDISFGRLNQFPYQQPQWYHAIAPLAIVLLTRKGIPVSTSFLVLSSFGKEEELLEMLYKSGRGYVYAAIVSYALWMVISQFVNEKEDVSKGSKKFWRTFQWLSTGFLWFTWLSHDVANIAVFLPRELEWYQLILVIVFFVIGLGFIFYKQGGAIQQIVLDKQSTKYVRSATLIDLVYACILLYFKEISDIPMSTTWVFVGLLCGRELALNTGVTKKGNLKNIFPIIAKDFIKLLVGLAVSVGIVFVIYGHTGQNTGGVSPKGGIEEVVGGEDAPAAEDAPVAEDDPAEEASTKETPAEEPAVEGEPMEDAAKPIQEDGEGTASDPSGQDID